MPKKSLEMRALAIALKLVPDSKTLAPGPGTNPTTPRTALRRCCAAWQRAFDAYMEHGKGDGLDKMFASKDAGVAYCNAMPMLAGPNGVRDFIACAAHGILIGAIPREKNSHLLYAAQVALGTFPREAKMPISPSGPTPLSTQNPPFEEGSSM